MGEGSRHPPEGSKPSQAQRILDWPEQGRDQREPRAETQEQEGLPRTPGITIWVDETEPTTYGWPHQTTFEHKEEVELTIGIKYWRGSERVGMWLERLTETVTLEGNKEIKK